jgi:hypothetical protein
MSATNWIGVSILNTITAIAGPMVTPLLTKHAVGSGVIASYFMGTSIIAGLVSLLYSGYIQYPEPWVLLAGLFYGAGMLGVQKSNERSPEPAISIAIPSSRAFLTAILAFIVLGSTTSQSLGITYMIQLGLCVLLIFTEHTYNRKEEPEPWSLYAFLSAGLLAISDIILKQSGSFDTVIGDTMWFSIAGSLIPVVMNYTKTGSVFPRYRDRGTIYPVEWWGLLIMMTVIFYGRVITQVLSISLAPNPALPRIIESMTVPCVAFLAWKSGRYKVTIHEIVILILMTIVSATSGWIVFTES